MNFLHLLPVGNVEAAWLEGLRPALAQAFGVPCRLLPGALDPAFAFQPNRQQYHSTEILDRLRARLQPDTWRLLGVTSADLCIPILTFVFGEAQLNGACALVSTHRLRQEFYGLPPDPALLRDRLLKEAIHELGHTLELQHCDDYTCAMAAAHAVEWIDLRSPGFCQHCRARILSQQAEKQWVSAR
ncbi:MAG TPA: archaemetzincin family Zn-dependent metalloprotease [Terriglobales bacterium]|nr:archaemetzincin family Zn-dependent metalloprotease [Terriglobales bacterium]